MAAVIIICKDCESEFKVHPWELKRGIQFCSRECYNAHKLKRRLMHDEICAGMGGEDR